jgi:catechol 2,3-dioxygenase-like lactoylglutathione lyase family enzyme
MKPLHGLMPMAGVADVERSIAFYRKLGFEEQRRHTPEGERTPVWAWLQSGTAHLMINQADEPIVPEKQGILFYMYSEDVEGYHDELERAGVEVGPIQHPFWAPRGEFQVNDPDGYCLMIAHT